MNADALCERLNGKRHSKEWRFPIVFLEQDPLWN
jgi:hypothetical protein